MYFNILAVLGCLWGNALGGYSQFFYTGLPVPVPQPQTYYRPALPAYQPYIPAPVFYNPVQHFYSHQGFAYHHTSPVVATPAPPPAGLPQIVQGENSNDGIRVNEENDSVEVNAEPIQRSETQTQPPVAAARTFNFERKESNAFRGFAYHTEYDDGARSNVVFLTGPEIHNYQSPIQKSINTHTPASDALDSNALKEEAQPRKFEVNPSIRALMDFLENPQVGVQKFYSVDNNLVARRLEDDYPTFPASTLPLNTPVSPIFSILRSNFNQEPMEEVQAQQKSNPEPLPLASEIKSNTVDADSTTTTTTTTTSAPSTTPEATTEAVSTTTELPASSTETAETSTTVSSSMTPIVVEDTTGDSKEESSR